MFKLFLDTNVLLDFLINERDGHPYAQKIIELTANDELTCYISPVSLMNIFYILRKQRNEQERKDIIGSLMDILDVVPMDYDTLQMGLYVPMKDYEDSVQYTCAKKANVDYLISSDKQFREHDLELKILTPEEFIQNLS